MKNKVACFILAMAVVFSVFSTLNLYKSYSLSKQEILNSAVLVPMKTGYTPTDKLIENFFAKTFTAGMTTYDKVKACYDETIYNTKYGASFDSRQVPVVQREYGFVAERDAYIALRAYTFLKGRVGVCNDYSCAFVALTRAIGLKSYIVTGKTNTTSGGYAGHMWVNVLINGVYYTFDPQVECNIMLRRSDKKITYSRFCVTDEDMKGRLILDHREYDVSLFNDFKKVNENVTYATIMPTATTKAVTQTTAKAETTTTEAGVLTVTADKQGKMRLGKEITFIVSGTDSDSVTVKIVKIVKPSSAGTETSCTAESATYESATVTGLCGETCTTETQGPQTTMTETATTDAGSAESETQTTAEAVTSASEPEYPEGLAIENGTAKWIPDMVGSFTVYFYAGDKQQIAAFEYEFFPEYEIITDGRYVTGIPEKMYTFNIETDENTFFKDPFGCDLPRDKFIGTGARYVTEGNEFIVYVKGDTDGDGILTSTDYIIIKRQILSISYLENEYLKAADTDSDGNLTATDYILVKRQILGAGDMYIALLREAQIND